MNDIRLMTFIQGQSLKITLKNGKEINGEFFVVQNDVLHLDGVYGEAAETKAMIDIEEISAIIYNR